MSDHPSHFRRFHVEHLVRLYDDYGLLDFLAEAWCICREDGVAHEELARRLDKVFAGFLASDTKNDALRVLGFGTGNKGKGPWQGKASRAIWKQDNDIDLVKQAVGLGMTKAQAYEWVAGAVGRTPAALKLLCLKGSRRRKK